tara:strand:- start:3069 stop:3500 length:432 start_codon:yes stop_codon:yes gene_type:complete
MLFVTLLFLFIVIPTAELVLLLMLGVRIGWMPTMGLIVFTGILGATLARQQGLSILRKIQTEMQNGRPPALEMVEGAMVVIGGMVLLTPGIITDGLGFALLVPGIRGAIANKIQKHFTESFKTGKAFSSSSRSRKKDDDVIDV